MKKNKEYPSIIEQDAELVYSGISERFIRFNKHNYIKVKTQGKTGVDKSELSRVMNNERNATRNPYLLNHSFLFDVEQIKAIKNKYNTYELIWGKGKEREQLLKQIFFNGITYLSQTRDAKNVEIALESDYTYAASKTYKLDKEDLKLKDREKKALYIAPIKNKKKEPVEKSGDFKNKNTNEPVEHLYKLLKPTFEEIHKKYFEKKEISKLPVMIIEFYKIFNDVLENFNELEGHRGVAVKEFAYLLGFLISGDLEEVIDIKNVNVRNFKGKDITDLGYRKPKEKKAEPEVSVETRFRAQAFIDSLIDDQKRLESKKNYFSKKSESLEKAIIGKIKI